MTKFFATLALAVSVFTVSAQENAKTSSTPQTQAASTTVQEKVAANTRKIASKLGLTGDQQRQLRPLLADFYTGKEKLAAIKTQPYRIQGRYENHCR